MPRDFKKIGEALRKRQAKRRKEEKKATKGFKEAKASTVGERKVTEGTKLKKASTTDDKKKKKKVATTAVKSPDVKGRTIIRGFGREEAKRFFELEGKRLRAKGFKNLKAKRKKKK